MKMKIGILIVLAAAVVTAIVLITKGTAVDHQIMDGDGMYREDVGTPEEMRGTWISDSTPQWSVNLEEHQASLCYYGETVHTFKTMNFDRFQGFGNNYLLEVNMKEDFAWPNRFHKTGRIQKLHYDHGLKLELQMDEKETMTLYFRQPEEGETPAKRILPETDTELIGLQFGTVGMAVSPYYSIYKDEDVYYLQQVWEVQEEDLGHAAVENVERSVVLDAEAVRQLYQDLLEYNILSWDGFAGMKSNDPDVLDADESFLFRMAISDGKTVNASGYNSFPGNYNEVMSLCTSFCMDAIEKAIHPSALSDSEVQYLKIIIGGAFYAPESAYYEIELKQHQNEWYAILQDPDGRVLAKGTDYHGKGTADSLPFDSFLDLTRRYESRNGEQDHSGNGIVFLQISAYFEDGTMFDLDTNVLPEDFDAFQEEFVKAVDDFCREAEKN